MTSNFAPLDKIVCDVEQIVIGKLLHICNVELLVIAPHDKFTIYAALSWFTLFWHKINLVAIYAFLCGAKITQNILSVDKYHVCPGLQLNQCNGNKPLTFQILCIQKVPLVEKAIMMIILMMIMNLCNAQGGQQNVPVFVEEHPLVFWTSCSILPGPDSTSLWVAPPNTTVSRWTSPWSWSWS